MYDNRNDVGFLGKVYGLCHMVPLDLHSQEPVYGSQIHDFKFGPKLILSGVKEVPATRGECQVIDCNDNNNNLAIFTLVEHRVFHCAACVQEFCEGLANSLVPAVPCLFKTIQGFEQVAHLSLIPRGHESQWLPHVDHFGESGIEICILHVNLPVVVHGKG